MVSGCWHSTGLEWAGLACTLRAQHPTPLVQHQHTQSLAFPTPTSAPFLPPSLSLAASSSSCSHQPRCASVLGGCHVCTVCRLFRPAPCSQGRTGSSRGRCQQVGVAPHTQCQGGQAPEGSRHKGERVRSLNALLLYYGMEQPRQWTQGAVVLRFVVVELLLVAVGKHMHTLPSLPH